MNGREKRARGGDSEGGVRGRDRIRETYNMSKGKRDERGGGERERDEEVTRAGGGKGREGKGRTHSCSPRARDCVVGELPDALGSMTVLAWSPASNAVCKGRGCIEARPGRFGCVPRVALGLSVLC